MSKEVDHWWSYQTASGLPPVMETACQPEYYLKGCVILKFTPLTGVINGEISYRPKQAVNMFISARLDILAWGFMGTDSIQTFEELQFLALCLDFSALKVASWF